MLFFISWNEDRSETHTHSLQRLHTLLYVKHIQNRPSPH